VFLFDSYELVRNRPGLNQIKVLVASNDYGADLCAKRKLLWMLHFFENGSFGLLERFPGLRRSARHCKMQAVCDGIMILRGRHLRLPSHGAANGGGNWPAAVHCETAGPPFAYQSGVCELGVERSELSIA
jgi:hypothetical protein